MMNFAVDRGGGARILAVLILVAAACSSPAATSTTVVVPTGIPATASASPASQNVLYIVDGVTVEVSAAARGWAEGAGLSVREGPEGELAEGLGLGELAFVVSRGAAGWAADPAFIASGVRGVAVDADEPAQPHLSVIGSAATRWDEAGFLAGVLAGYAGAGDTVGILESDGSPDRKSLADGFDQGVRYSCPRCDLLRAEAGAFDPADFVRNGADSVFVAPGALAPEAARKAAEAGLWFVWMGDLPSGLPIDHLAGRVRLAPEALVAFALQSLADGEAGQSWSYSVETASLLLADLNAEAISPGKQRLAQEVWDKLAGGVLQLMVPQGRQPSAISQSSR